MNILVLNGSSREQGNTEQLTQAVLKEIPHKVIHLREQNILPIDDKRHAPEGFPPVQDDFHTVLTEVLAHDVLIFATPLYWYGMSGVMKNFIDRWSQALRLPEYNFKEAMKGKAACVVIAGGDQPRLKGLPLIQQFQYLFGFVNTSFHGFIIGEGNKPGDILQDERAITEANALQKAILAKLQG